MGVEAGADEDHLRLEPVERGHPLHRDVPQLPRADLEQEPEARAGAPELLHRGVVLLSLACEVAPITSRALARGMRLDLWNPPRPVKCKATSPGSFVPWFLGCSNTGFGFFR